MNLLLLTSHAIAEYDDLRMFTDLGYDVFSIGGAYSETPFEGKRPALPNVVRYPDLEAACWKTREAHLEPPGDRIDWAKADLADDIIDWADVIIVHHFPERWIRDQWSRIAHKDVIWRTCGQSDPRLEASMFPLRAGGLHIIRYSPAEQRAFERTGHWAGQDAVIRFGKYPGDYGPWNGSEAVIGNITQHMAQRGEACGYGRWSSYTEGLPVKPAGPGSEVMRGGIGGLSYEDMLVYLRTIRVYFYTGTQPASYTLGLMEAMLSGVPVVPVRWRTDGDGWHWLADLWEASDIVPQAPPHQNARLFLETALSDIGWAQRRGDQHRQRALDLFDVATVGRQWVDFLGQP